MFKKLKKKTILMTAAITLGSSPIIGCISASQPVQAARKSSMKSYVRNVMAKNHVRGDILVVKDGKVQNITYGYGNYARRINNNNNSLVYPTASLQKVVTAAMVMQLMKETKNTKKAFNQNTTISRWYPYLKNSSRITVGNLLTHTSGLEARNTETNRGRIYSENQAIKWMVNQANANTYRGVGYSFVYGNVNYVLLAGIIRQVTGKSYATNLNHRIVKKLGLSKTFVASQVPNNKINALSYTYNYYNYRYPSAMSNTVASQIPGAGNLYTTPEEYYKILVGLSNGKILSQSQFHTMAHLKSKKSTYSGGLYIKKKGKLKLAYGAIEGTYFGNWAQLTSDNKSGIIMFLNQTNGNKYTEKEIGYKILNRIRPNYFSKK